MADPNDSSLLLFNPELMGPYRQMAYGQALLGQAADVGPLRSPWQAAARALSGALGGYEMGAGQRGLVSANETMRAASDARVREALYGDGSATQPPAPSTTALPPTGTQPAAARPTASIVEPPALKDVYDTAAASSGIPRNILVGQHSVESGFDNNQVSSSGAAGIPQILASTADNPGPGITPLGAENRVKPERAIPWAANYLAYRGKKLFGDKWDPTDQTMMREALKGYGDGTEGYADKVFAAAGGGAGGRPVTVATDTATAALGPAQSTTDGLAIANRYERAAMALSGSMNPIDRARATMFMQQAQFYRTQGSWGPPVQRADGTISQTNRANNQISIQGRPTVLTMDANHNLVDNTGRVVSKSKGYTLTNQVGPDGVSRVVIGPDGKPEVMQFPQATAETTARQDMQTLTSLSPKMEKGTASADEQQQYNIAYARVGKPELKWNEGTKTWDQVPSTALPPGLYKPPGAMGGTAPSAAPSSGVPATSTGQTPVPVTKPAFFTGPVEDTIKEDTKASREAQAKTAEGETILANSQTIRDLVQQGAMSGWAANIKTEIARIGRGLGATDEQIANLTGIKGNVPATQELNKLLFSISTQRARDMMGAREASSALQQFREAYPNIETDPNATDAMLRFNEALQYYQRDRSQAMNSYRLARQGELERGTVTPGTYGGLGNFEAEFRKTHDIRTYTTASQILARDIKTGDGTLPAVPQTIWGRSMDAAGQATALANALRMNNGQPFKIRTQSGEIKTIGPNEVRLGLEHAKVPSDNPDFRLQ